MLTGSRPSSSATRIGQRPRRASIVIEAAWVRSDHGLAVRRYDRYLGKCCYGAVNHGYYQERQQPELLPRLGEAPQINKSTQGHPPFDFCSLLHRLVRAPAFGHSTAK